MQINSSFLEIFSSSNFSSQPRIFTSSNLSYSSQLRLSRVPVQIQVRQKDRALSSSQPRYKPRETAIKMLV